MGARAAWNRFGTPGSLTPQAGGYLATGLAADELAAAREWIWPTGACSACPPRARNLERSGTHRSAPERSRSSRRFGALDAGIDGRITLSRGRETRLRLVLDRAPREGLRPSGRLPAPRDAARGRLAPQGLHGCRDSVVRRELDQMEIRGYTGPQTASLVAVPTPRNGVRSAWLTQLIDTREPLAVATYVDATTGVTLVRQSLVDYATDNPAWDVFPASPPIDYSSTDTRETWCWTAGPGCDLVVGNPSRRSRGTCVRPTPA